MFSLVLSLSTLKCLLTATNGNRYVWGLIAKKLGKYKGRIYVDDYYIGDDYNILANLRKNDILDTSKIDDIKAIVAGEYSRVKEFPNCAFILDVDRQTADRIQHDYGVLVQALGSLDSLDSALSVLTKVEPDYIFLPSGKYVEWSSVLSGLTNPMTPSRSIVIVDRYLFSDDRFEKNGPDNKPKTNGVENVKAIIKALVSTNVKYVFNVLILYQASKNRTEDDECTRLKSIAEALNQIKKDKSFENMKGLLNIDIIGTWGSSGLDDYTHNRRIYSNYYTITADHKLCAFGMKPVPQNINVYKLFSKGMDGMSVIPLLEQMHTLNGISAWLRDVRNPHQVKLRKSVLYAHNGRINEEIEKYLYNDLVVF